MSVEKHNNNFFLYALGSAFMLVSGAMLIASPSFDVAVNFNQSQTASAIESQTNTQVFVPVTISGTVAELEQNLVSPVSGVSVLLFSVDSSGVSTATQAVQTNTQGQYVFSVPRSGSYRVVVPWVDDFEIILPEQNLEGFEVRQTSQEVFVRQGKDLAHIDFVGISLGE